MENKELIKKLKKEQEDLNEKLHKLDLFITKQDDSQTISNYQLKLLRDQHKAMWVYSEVLGMRISDLEDER